MVRFYFLFLAVLLSVSMEAAVGHMWLAKVDYEISYSGFESEELDFVIEGTVDICIDGKMERLEAGDSIYFDARRPHGLKAVGETVAKLISIAF